MTNSVAKVLVVDDEPAVVAYIAKMLSLEGYDIENAYDGDEAVSIAKTFRPDCVVTGVIMPKMGGFDEAIAILKFLPSCKFVFMSGSSDHPDVRAGHAQLGPDRGPLLPKPFKRLDMLNALAAVGFTGNKDQ